MAGCNHMERVFYDINNEDGEEERRQQCRWCDVLLPVTEPI